MGESRYLYYLVFLNMFVNIIFFIPNILISHRFEGALMAIFVSIPLSIGLMYLFLKYLARFPKQGLPEILEQCLFNGAHTLIKAMFGVLWFGTGLILLLAFIKINKDFINPDISRILILSLFLVLVCLASRLESTTLLFGLEILMLVNVPIILFVLIKSILNPHFSWDAIAEIGTHLLHVPSFDSLGAATFIFSGYTNMIIFHRVFGERLKGYHFGVFIIFGLLTLLTSFLIPIGFHGTYAANRYVNPWVVTADSMRIEFFIIERLVFPFIMLYFTIALISTIIHWHIAIEFFKKIPPTKWKQKGRIPISWYILFLFVAITFLSNYFLDEEKLISLSNIWLQIRLIGEFFLVTVLIYATRRSKKI